jgi:uncharacterized protein (DUF2252 family)
MSETAGMTMPRVGDTRPSTGTTVRSARSSAPSLGGSALSPSERAARGRAARAAVPRADHGVFEPSADRPDPIDLLEEQATTRVPELVPIRYGRMLVSPFAFFRGAALVMASDLASTPTSGLRVQACGDAHLSNFGVFGSPERNLVFDLNDFDETLPGPWEWDLKRLAASLVVASRDNQYGEDEIRSIALAAASEYRAAMATFAVMPNLEVWYAHFDLDKALPELQSQLKRKRAKKLADEVAKVRTRDSTQAFAKLARVVDGEPRITSDPPLIVPIEELVGDVADRQATVDELLGVIRTYRRTIEAHQRHLVDQFRFCHLARKVVGVGSVGTRAWIGLFVGRDDGDPLFIQIKEAEASVLERFVGKSQYKNHGQRVVVGQRLMQTVGDIFLGWERTPAGLDGQARDFYVRQLRDWKYSLEIGAMLPRGMALYARLCGWTLARAHARSGDRIAIAAYLGKSEAFDQSIARFAEAYADQNERDHAALAGAVQSGRIKAETGL